MTTLTLVYDHHGAKFTERLLEVQHERFDAVVSTTHVNLDHASCLEVIILRGRADELRTFAARLCGLKGVEAGKLVVAASGGQRPLRATACSGTNASNGGT